MYSRCDEEGGEGAVLDNVGGGGHGLAVQLREAGVPYCLLVWGGVNKRIKGWIWLG